MPVVASAALEPPDHSIHPTLQQVILWLFPSSELPLVALVACAGLLVFRVVAQRRRGSSRITSVGISARRNTREDYTDKPLAYLISERVGSGVGARTLSSLLQAIWMTDGSAQERSRGVSMSPAKGISSQDAPAAEEESRIEALFDGSGGQNPQISTMDGGSWPGVQMGLRSDPDRMFASTVDNGAPSLGSGSAEMPEYITPRHWLAGSSAPLPFTPSPPSSGDFTFQERRPSYAVSIPPQLEGSFHPLSFPRQPHLNYPIPSSSTEAVASAPSSPPRHRSPLKTLPVAIPTTGAYDTPYHAATGGMLPASFPTSSPLLPPPPPETYYYPSYEMPSDQSYEFEGDEEATTTQGEIPHNHGWGRHTRVWGGGVCLACQASGEGYYGPNVPPEHRR